MSPAIFITTTFISFIGYFLVSWQAGKMGAEKIFHKDAEVGKLALLNYKHAAGIFFFSILPFVVLPDAADGFLPLRLARNPWNLAGFGLLVILVALAAAHLVRQKKKRFTFPVNDQAVHRPFMRYLAIRAVFLMCYEIFFRGFLLFGCILWVGLAMALIINIVLYMLMHAFTDWPEILACIPFGLAVCWMTLAFRSIWPAVFLHLELSMVYEIQLYRHYLRNKKEIRE